MPTQLADFRMAGNRGISEGLVEGISRTSEIIPIYAKLVIAKIFRVWHSTIFKCMTNYFLILVVLEEGIAEFVAQKPLQEKRNFYNWIRSE